MHSLQEAECNLTGAKCREIITFDKDNVHELFTARRCGVRRRQGFVILI